MQQSNLAAAILRCSAKGPVLEPHGLTNEDAISLADWLQSESIVGTWRSISLAPQIPVANFTKGTSSET